MGFGLGTVSRIDWDVVLAVGPATDRVSVSVRLWWTIRAAIHLTA